MHVAEAAFATLAAAIIHLGLCHSGRLRNRISATRAAWSEITSGSTR
jgi:hypothetical protein